MWELFSTFIRLGQGSHAVQREHTQKKHTRMHKRHRTQTQFVVYFQEGDFFRGTACLILCGRENLMPLNRFSPGKREKLDLRTGNFIWQDWLRVGERGEEEKPTKGVWGGGENLYCSAESAVPHVPPSLLPRLSCSSNPSSPPFFSSSSSAQRIPSPSPRSRRCCQPLSVCRRAILPLFPSFFLNTDSESNRLKVKSHKATAGANRLLSKLEVNSEGAAMHSKPFDPTPHVLGPLKKR